jgi:hypothetical protein
MIGHVHLLFLFWFGRIDSADCAARSDTFLYGIHVRTWTLLTDWVHSNEWERAAASGICQIQMCS